MARRSWLRNATDNVFTWWGLSLLISGCVVTAVYAWEFHIRQYVM